MQSGTEVSWPVGGIVFNDPRGYTVEQVLAMPAFKSMRGPLPSEGQDPAGPAGKRPRQEVASTSPKTSSRPTRNIRQKK